MHKVIKVLFTSLGRSHIVAFFFFPFVALTLWIPSRVTSKFAPSTRTATFPLQTAFTIKNFSDTIEGWFDYVPDVSPAEIISNVVIFAKYWDFAYSIIYAIFFASVIALLLKQLNFQSEGRKYRASRDGLLFVSPIFAGFLDLGENYFIIKTLAFVSSTNDLNFLDPSLVFTTSVFGTAKLILLSISILTVLFLLPTVLYRNIAGVNTN